MSEILSDNIENVDKTENSPGCMSNLCAGMLKLFSCLLITVTFPISMGYTLRTVQEYERGVIFRMGRLKKKSTIGPGMYFIIPCIDKVRIIDLRTVSFDVPPQEILTKDSVTVTVDAVVYYKVVAPLNATCNVEDYSKSTRQLASTTLRTILGTKSLTEILAEKEIIANDILHRMDAATDPWGINVERVEIKDVRLPKPLQRAMAAEAEATREARAKVISAEGEMKASQALKDASDVISDSPSALQLRYLQTLTHISAEKNSTIIFPLPMDLVSTVMTNLAPKNQIVPVHGGQNRAHSVHSMRA